MADKSLRLSWDEAIQVLDANFHFRTPTRLPRERRSYRASPNGASLDIWQEDDSIFIELPVQISTLSTLSKNEVSGRYRYSISDMNGLLEGIKALEGKAVSTTRTPTASQTKEEPSSSMDTARNVILYGPPGTGKTYKTVERAVEICDGPSGQSRGDLMMRYEELRKEGRISFVTFHQSYGYEDFVEGLRPESKDGQVTYRVRPGIFREVCDAARRSTLVKPGLHGKPLQDRTVYKMSFGIAGTSEGNRVFQECIANGYALLGWGDDVDFSECTTVAEIRKKLEDEHKDIERLDSQVRFVSTFKNEVKNGDLIIASQGNKAFRAIGEVIGDYEYLEAGAAGNYHQMRPVRWLAVFEGNRPVDDIYEKNFQQSTLYRLDNDAIKFDALDGLINERRGDGNQPFVLIIDEINRANISKAFGELITLLEPDKREGEENALTVKLPYSGDEFSVPSNLYVVGTMNTADRSIALLDTALRRRFEFEELQPSPETLQGVSIDGVGLTAMLQALNERVEYLYDRDHTIGHAYFINVRTLEDLEATFRRKVIPLLQEYFYEDWSKVRLALNDQSGQFIETIEGIPKGLENTADGYEARPRYRVRKGPFSLDAYLNIYR
jgi:5-methylcytosine-specific restriction protein B